MKKITQLVLDGIETILEDTSYEETHGVGPIQDWEMINDKLIKIRCDDGSSYSIKIVKTYC